MSSKKAHKRKDHYIKDGKKVSTKRKHSDTYSNETYKHVKEGKHLTDSQGRQRASAGKGDANRVGDYENFRDNFDEIEW
jgi:hypothetical protein